MKTYELYSLSKGIDGREMRKKNGGNIETNPIVNY